jgi:hypothetical protein
MILMIVAKSKTGTTTQNELWPPLSGLRDLSCFFYEVVLSTQCPQPRLHEEKTPSITRESNPAHFGEQSVAYTFEPFDRFMMLMIVEGFKKGTTLHINLFPLVRFSRSSKSTL